MIGLRGRHQTSWAIFCGFIAVLVCLPIIAIVVIAFTAHANIWPHLLETAFSRYLGNTLLLVASVGAGSMILGSLLAYLVTHLEFPGRKILQYLLFLPLAVPSFVAAFAWVEVLEYAGPLQTSLRGVFGWNSPVDYHFPQIRSLGGAAVVLTLTLYPYVYLMARASFRTLPASGRDVARSMGLREWPQFLRVALPQARPGIVAGTAIVMMETINDFGTVDYFAVQTLTTGIFSIWLEGQNAGGAAQLALFALVLIALLAWAEKRGRRGAKFHRTARQVATIAPQPTAHPFAWVLSLGCCLPILFGFVLPVWVLAGPTLIHPEVWTSVPLWQAAWNSLKLGGITAIVTLSAALILVFGLRRFKSRIVQFVIPITTLGYAVPGAILGLGVLLPLITLDHFIADTIQDWTGSDPGLLLTGGIFVLVLAFSIRFFAIAVGATDAGLAAISPSLPHAARALGQSDRGVLWRISIPMMKGTLATALLLVFVDTLKELPATLLLRPFNFETLSTHIYAQASLENFTATAPGAILIVTLSLIAVILLAKANR